MGDDARGAAMVEFLGTFPTISGSPPASLADLSDGVALFEVLSEISPEYFDPTTIARHLGDNWALKSSNLRKLLRNLEYYFHEELKKDADFEAHTSNVGNIARSGDPAAISSLVELVAAAAVTCEHKGEFVGRIMGMTPESQLQMKGIIQSSLSRLSDFDGGDDDGDDNEMVFGETMTSEEKINQSILYETNRMTEDGMEGMDGAKEELERHLLETQMELSQFKSQTSELREDAEKSQAKLRALVEDLQDRLAARQDELIKSEEELRTMTTELDETKSRLHELEEQRAQLADDLDVASAKANQLHKAEATVMAYKKKLEGVGVINQQMTDLEDQAAGYLRQIMDLESEVRKTTALQKQVDNLQNQLAGLEKEKTNNSDSLKATAGEVSELRNRLNAAENAKRLYETELTELRAQQNVEPVDVGGAVEGFDGTQNLSAAREKAMRLEIENKKLQEQLANLTMDGATPAAVPAVSAQASADTAALQAEVQQLKENLAKKEAENKKIGGDKDKLEAYTKRTLAKFQDKYLVALQECKAKLKEKQDKIEILESRSATEKTAQKREERLLSSTIYELGLAIMQNRLKER